MKNTKIMVTNILTISDLTMALLLSAFLGIVLGVERELAGKTAGVRTYSLVSLGACMFALISKYGFVEFWGVQGFDPSRVASQIVVGVGFIGAGLIIFQQSKLQGLTTAAGLWVAAGIGMATAFKLYYLAIFATVLTLVIFVALWFFEEHIVKKYFPKRDD